MLLGIKVDSREMIERVNPMEARQRRMELRRSSTSKSFKKRFRDDDSIDNDDDRSFSSSDNSTTTAILIADSKMMNKKQKNVEPISSNSDTDLSMYRGIKKQARYEPTIPISSKAELAAWRKEARRIRNRESAAASRNKTRERIEELEGQLLAMQNEYSTALQRIVELENRFLQQDRSDGVAIPPQVPVSVLADSTTTRVSPALLPSKPTASPTDLNIGGATLSNDEVSTNTEETGLLIWSPDHQSAAKALANSLMYDSTPSDDAPAPNVVAPDQMLHSRNYASDTTTSSTIITSSTGINALNTTHQDIKISRPTAVCVASI